MEVAVANLLKFLAGIVMVVDGLMQGTSKQVLGQ
jgi:hypothetical protein